MNKLYQNIREKLSKWDWDKIIPGAMLIGGLALASYPAYLVVSEVMTGKSKLAFQVVDIETLEAKVIGKNNRAYPPWRNPELIVKFEKPFDSKKYSYGAFPIEWYRISKDNRERGTFSLHVSESFFEKVDIGDKVIYYIERLKNGARSFERVYTQEVFQRAFPKSELW